MGKNKAYLNCLSRRQAQDLWREKIAAAGFFADPPAETVSVDAALGRVTAASVHAKISVPHYNGAAMDGIAVWAPDTFGAQETAPRRLTILSAAKPFQAGGCYMVDTGDPMPAGTNAVIMVEDIHSDGATAEITAAATPWQHVRIIGEDIVAQEMVVPEHRAITPVDIAALLAAGLETVAVVKKPRVAVIPTGDELVATSRELAPGAILDVNSHMLAAAVTTWGGEPVRQAIVRDNSQAIKQAVFASLQTSDMVIINAGTSAGREDYTADVLAELGEVLVHGVAIKPGKPVVLAVCQGKPVIGLPGYPVSAMLTAELFVHDVLLARQKLPVPEPAPIDAALVKQVASTVGVEEYIRVALGSIRGKTVAAPQARGAGLISSLTKAQGIIAVDEATTGLAAGAVVQVTPLGRIRPADTILAVGSHDMALDLLGVHLRRRSGNLTLACANVGSMGGMMAIRNNEAHIAGIHLLDGATGLYNVSQVEKYLPGGSWQLVHMAMRQQGLMVRPGNPRGITGLADLARPGFVFVNRQRGSGTRMLIDFRLAQDGIDAGAIAGYEKEVGTHMAVAATVAAGAADAGLGVQAAALALGLDFIPVAEEQYDLILNFAADDQRGQYIIDILRSGEFWRE
ncbi:MAG TPA: molybdopterin biosynthesis protein, partial [Negativicutes bacterium]|nr:molybdopterin biosynthesis protein [Negativicutes bacterium]